MQLTLDKKDVEKILLDWAEYNYPSAKFNTIDIVNGYSSKEFVTITKEEPEEESKS